MPSARPELLVVAGPAQGARAVLMTDTVTVGRSAECDIRIPEQSVSRHQLTFTADPDGWLVENVSKQTIRINDKKYKAGRKAYLETGDALYLGTASVVLFVSAGDDPDQAARAFLQEHPVPVDVPAAPASPPTDAPPAPAETPARVAGSGPAPPIPEAPVAEPPTDVPPVAEGAVDGPAALQEQDILAERRKKLIKYGIGAGAYAVILIVLFVILSSLSSDDGDDEIGSAPGWYRDDDIRTMLAQEYELRRNAAIAEDYLQVARQMFRDHGLSPGNLFRCVKHYKLYLAYRAGSRFESTQDERDYIDALGELTEGVTGVYRSAYANSQNKNWSAARQEFMDLLEMLPVDEPPAPFEDARVHKLVRNIRDHIGYVNRAMREKKRR